MGERLHEQAQVSEFRRAHEDKYQELLKLCWGCPGCGMREKEIVDGEFVEEEFCLNSGGGGLHLDWLLPMLLNEDGEWEFPEICDDYGKKPASWMQFMVKPIVK